MAKDYILDAKLQVVGLFNAFRNEGVPELKPENTYVLWYNQTLTSCRAFVTTVFPDELYYEVTHETETGKTTIAIFSKEQQFMVGDDEEDPNQLNLLIEETVTNSPNLNRHERYIS
jgi:hypothetical protein